MTSPSMGNQNKIMLSVIYDKAFSGASISREEALFLCRLSGEEHRKMTELAGNIREKHRGNSADLCAIVNAKSGLCPEDCRYCAQSAGAKSGAERYGLKDKGFILEKAREAKDGGAGRFCIVTSGMKPGPKELGEIAEMIREIASIGLRPCATLGMLGVDELRLLKASGLARYHHNLETSRRFFPEICSTHTYGQKLETIKAVKNAGLSLCSGGIFGLGEEWEDRVDMALELRELGADSVPINFLMPIKGTPLAEAEPLSPEEALKIISLHRFILPDKEIRVCGGRAQTLGDLNSMVFKAGADGILTGNYLTTTGRSFGDDLRLVAESGLHPAHK